MGWIERKAEYLRMLGLRSRARHLWFAFMVLSATGVYVALVTKRFHVGVALIVLANVFFCWGLTLRRRANDMIRMWEKEMRR